MLDSYIYLALFMIATIIICYISIQKYKRIINPLLFAIIPLCLACLFAGYNNELDAKELSTGLRWMLIGTLVFLLSFSVGTPLRVSINRTARKEGDVHYNKKTVNILVNLLCILLFADFLMTFAKVYSIAGSVKDILISSTWVRNQYLHRSEPKLNIMIGLIMSMNITVISCILPKAIQLKCRHIRVKFIYVVLFFSLKFG